MEQIRFPGSNKCFCIWLWVYITRFFAFPCDCLSSFASYFAEQISQNLAYFKAKKKELPKFGFSCTLLQTSKRGLKLMQEFTLSFPFSTREIWMLVTVLGKAQSWTDGRTWVPVKVNSRVKRSLQSFCIWIWTRSEWRFRRPLMLEPWLDVDWNMSSSSFRGRAIFHGFGYSLQASITLSPCQIYNQGQLPVISGHCNFIWL